MTRGPVETPGLLLWAIEANDPAMLVRDATDNDLAPIVAIFNYAVRNTTAVFSTIEASVETRAAWLAAQQADGFSVLVAEIDEKVAGFASYGGVPHVSRLPNDGRAFRLCCA